MKNVENRFWVRESSKISGLTLMVMFGLVFGGLPAGAVQAQDEAQSAEQEGEGEEGQTVRRRLIDATNQETEWTPSFDMTPAEERRELIQRGQQALSANRLEGENGAVAYFARANGLAGGSADADAGLTRAIAAVVREAEAALARGAFDQGARLAALARQHRPNDPAVRNLQASVASGREQAQRLAEAGRQVEAGNLITPTGTSALDLYREVLASDGNNAAAKAGLQNIERLLIAQADRAIEADGFAEAERLLASAAALATGTSLSQDASVRLVERRQQRSAAITGELQGAIAAGDFDAAERHFATLEAVAVQGGELDELRRQLDNARNYASHSPGDVIADDVASGGKGPELVVIPLGSYEMGSPNGEKNRATNEGPRFTVNFKRGFALGRNEITVGQFQQFVNATGYVPRAQQQRKATVYDETAGTLAEKSNVDWRHDHLGDAASPDLPVINVSWQDAKAYTDWLARETGKKYRLPTETEFEYALRAGTVTTYPWGDGNPAAVVGNFTGDGDRSKTRRNWANAFPRYEDGHWGPAPVRTYPANAFGLYDMEGNVSEWVEDCWHDTYQRAPTDGSAWVNPGCELRVLRGASWASAPDQVRSAFRLSAPADATNPRLGFRVAREL
ncbi:MAG TPA: sulfatase-modifying factor protein [Xanthomonadales bacterium]|nr:sulfatase-modifying factor protein [Xanthomonadales bacterium]